MVKKKDIIDPVIEDKIVNITEYTMKLGLMNNFDRAGSYIKAINKLDGERGVVWVSEVMGTIIAKVDR